MSARERVLLAVLGFVILPLGLWFLVAQPMLEARDSAAARLVEARALQTWVLEQDAAWRAQGGTGGTQRAAQEPVGMSGIERALTEAGLRGAVTTLENAQGGGISLRLEGVQFVAFGRFLETVERDLGYDAETLRLTRGDAPGAVVAQLELVPEV